MRKTGRKILVICLSLVLLCSMLTSCGNSSQSFKRDDKWLLGLVDGTSDINTEVESTLTNDYVSEVAGTLGAKSYRFWMHFSRILSRDANSNEIIINQNVANKFHEFIDSLKEQGVERFICMTSNYLHPYGYDPTTANVIPDPLTEPEEYQAFLDLFEECFRVLAEEFPEIDYFEPGNEPDLYNGQNLCRNGYEWQGADNGNYLWSDNDGTHIVADMCWYARQGVKSIDEENQIVLPGLCGYGTTVNYVEKLYQSIESKTLPTGSDTAYVDPDEYFDILNWHPYLLDEGAPEMNEEWVDLQRRIYAVAEEHGDGEKPVWFTEMGFTDLDNDSVKEEHAENMKKLLDYVKEELEFVETVFVFRVSNLTGTARMSTFEDNFGLFYSLNDEDESKAGQPKPIAIALYKWFHGDDADLTPLYDLADWEE